MSRNYFFSIMLFISIYPLTLVPLSAQEEEGEIIIISERVGKEIDPEENDKFKLFEGINGFQSAVYIKLPDGRCFLKIIYQDEKTGELKISRTHQSEASIKSRGDYIDRFEEIQAEKHQFQNLSKPQTVSSDSGEIQAPKQQTVSVAPNSSAQGIVAKGFKGGLNLANVRGEGFEDADSRVGFAIGGFVTYSVNKQFSLRPEIYYTTKGCKLKVKGSESDVDSEISYSIAGSFSLNYLEIPALGVFAVNKNINLFAGPY